RRLPGRRTSSGMTTLPRSLLFVSQRGRASAVPLDYRFQKSYAEDHNSQRLRLHGVSLFARSLLELAGLRPARGPQQRRDSS
ncbi:hypothetical protein H8959_010993, partial [Pygathrix nigripes]